MKINLDTIEETIDKTKRSIKTNPTDSKPADGRNDYLFKLACSLVSKGLPAAVIEQAVQAANVNCNDEHHPNFVDGPLPLQEVQSVIKSAYKYKGEVPSESGFLDKDVALVQMNEKHAIVMEAGKTIAISERYDDMLERYIHERHSIADIRNFYKQPVLVRVTKGTPHTHPLGKFWTDHPDARKYSRVVFQPGGGNKEHYNLWRGFAFEPKKGNWSLLRQHMYDNVCDSNDLYFGYFMGWLARMVQKPDCPGEVAIVLRGNKGTGKSVTWRHIGKIFGQHYLQISNSKHLVGNFNSHLQDTILLFADEAFFAGDKKQEPILKTIITEPFLFIEPKNVNAYTCPNFLHLAMASNNRWVVPASGDERRYFVLDVSDAQKQNSEYFANIEAQMKNGGYEAMLYDLLRYNISDFNHREVPETPAMIEQKLQSLDPMDHWLLEKLMDGEWVSDPQGDFYSWESAVPTRIIQEEYLSSMKQQNVTYRSFSTQLGMYLKKVFPTLRKTGKNYLFPPLEESRKAFEIFKNCEYDWPEEDDLDNPLG